MNRAELYNSFPDGLKKAIRAYEPLERKNIAELYAMLLALREKFDLSPWHPLTAFIKMLAIGCRVGRPFTMDNMWISRSNTDDTYTAKDIKWANVIIHVHVGDTVKVVHAAVWPAKNKLWSYQTEYGVKDITIPRYGKTKYRNTRLSQGWLNDQALTIIKNTGNSHKPVALHYYFGSAETMRYRRGGLKMQDNTSKRAKPEGSITLKDVLTPDPEEPKADKSVFGVMSLDTPTPMTSIKTGVLEPGDSEILLTMLEMAGRKLEELGMHHTLQRWRATIRRLTNNEKDTAQTETQTQTADETD